MNSLTKYILSLPSDSDPAVVAYRFWHRILPDVENILIINIAYQIEECSRCIKWGIEF